MGREVGRYMREESRRLVIQQLVSDGVMKE